MIYQSKKFITILFFYFSNVYGWDALADFPGPERLDPNIINLDEKIYVIGGSQNIHPGYPLFDVWVYDTELNTWEEKNQLPSNLYNTEAFFVVADEIIYGMFKNKLYKYFPFDDNWVLFNTSYPGDGGGFNDISPRGFSDGNNLYVGFGYRWSDGYYLGYYYLDRDIYKFDTNTSTWSWFDEWDDFYIGSKISTINDNIYIIADNSIYSYDILEKTMDLISPIPLEYIELNEDNNGQLDYDSYINNLGFIAMENSLHLLGGYAYNIDGYQFHEQHLYQNDHFKYSFTTNVWSFEEESLPASNSDYLGRGNPPLTSIGDNLYLGFGKGNYFYNLDPSGNYAHNDLWVLNIYQDNSVEPLTLLSPPDQEIIDISNGSGVYSFFWNDPNDIDTLDYQLVFDGDLESLQSQTINSSLAIIQISDVIERMVHLDIDSLIGSWRIDISNFESSSNENQNGPFQITFINENILSSNDNAFPKNYSLKQNYPNPFNPTTQIRYDLPDNEFVSINIYDVMGRKVKSLVSINQEAGYRSITWNATNDLGQPVSAGMYIYTIQAGEFKQTREMVLLK